MIRVPRTDDLLYGNVVQNRCGVNTINVSVFRENPPCKRTRLLLNLGIFVSSRNRVGTG